MNKIIVILIMAFSTLIGAVGSLFLKKGSEKFNLDFKKGIFKLAGNLLNNWRIIVGIMLYVFSTVFFILLLRTEELSVLYPMTALSYIFVTLLSIKFLRERMNIYKWIGIGTIILGVVLVTV